MKFFAMTPRLYALANQAQRGLAENLFAILRAEPFHLVDHCYRVFFAHVERRIGADYHAVRADQINQIAQSTRVMRECIVVKAAQQRVGLGFG